MTYSFRAHHVFAEDDGHTTTVGFADDAFDPSQFVILQLAHQFDEQDEQLNMDKVYIQVGDQFRSKYGGVTAINVRENSLQLDLDVEAKNVLQVSGNIEVALDDKHPDLAAVISALKEISEREGIPFRTLNS